MCFVVCQDRDGFWTCLIRHCHAWTFACSRDARPTPRLSKRQQSMNSISSPLFIVVIVPVGADLVLRDTSCTEERNSLPLPLPVFEHSV